VCSQELIRIEWSFHLAELHDHLVGVRKYRRTYCILAASYRGAFKPGNGPATRPRKDMTQAGQRIDDHRIRYQAAWEAADRLNPGGPWSQVYRWLDRKDIRGPNPGDDLTDLAAVRKARVRDMGVGCYEQSWIWLTVDAEDEPIDSVRVQWAKMNANATRWEEERIIVTEETRRTLASCEYEAAVWEARVGSRHGTAPHALTEALDSYALRQAAIWRARVVEFARAWLPILAADGLGSEWTGKYSLLVSASDRGARTVVPNSPTQGAPHSSPVAGSAPSSSTTEDVLNPDALLERSAFIETVSGSTNRTRSAEKPINRTILPLEGSNPVYLRAHPPACGAELSDGLDAPLCASREAETAVCAAVEDDELWSEDEAESGVPGGAADMVREPVVSDESEEEP
jgi:hypothetical protein